MAATTRTKGASSVLLAGCLALVTFLLAFPGLGGGWIYDDATMVGNDAYDSVDDIARCWVRDSADYMGTEKQRSQNLSQTYRPLTMMTLVAVQALWPVPFAHHVLGFGLHLLTVLLLYYALRAPAFGRCSPTLAFWLCAWTALHPTGTEAWVWINGRSDLTAGSALAALALLLSFPGLAAHLAVAATGFFGMGCKETFLPAAVALWLGYWLRVRRAGVSTGAEPVAGAALVAGVALHLVLRVFVSPTFLSNTPTATTTWDDPQLWLFAPKLLGAAVHAWASMRVSPMESLAWIAARPWSESEVTGLVLVGLIVLLLIRGRDWGGVILLGGAGATLLPTVVISRALWFGLDRYLYMPALLMVLCLAPWVAQLGALQGSLARARNAAAWLILLVCGFGLHFSSRFYHSSQAWTQGMLEHRPDDPTVRSLLVATAYKAGAHEVALAHLRRVPPPPWPGFLVMEHIQYAELLHAPDELDRAVRYGLEAHREVPVIRAHGMRWHFLAGRFDEALELARSLRGTPHCAEAARQLLIWRARSDRALAARIDAALAEMGCVAPIAQGQHS